MIDELWQIVEDWFEMGSGSPYNDTYKVLNMQVYMIAIPILGIAAFLGSLYFLKQRPKQLKIQLIAYSICLICAAYVMIACGKGDFSLTTLYDGGIKMMAEMIKYDFLNLGWKAYDVILFIYLPVVMVIGLICNYIRKIQIVGTITSIITACFMIMLVVFATITL